MQAPGSSQAGSGRVSTRCVCVPACPLRRDFASAGRSPKAVPEKRAAAAEMRGAAAARETAVHRKAGIQAAAPQAQRASSPTCSQSLQPNMQPNRQSYHHSFPAAHARVAGPEQERVALRTVADSGKTLPLQPFGSACPSTRSGYAVPCGTSRSQTRVSSLPGPANPALCAPGRLGLRPGEKARKEPKQRGKAGEKARRRAKARKMQGSGKFWKKL